MIDTLLRDGGAPMAVVSVGLEAGQLCARVGAHEAAEHAWTAAARCVRSFLAESDDPDRCYRETTALIGVLDALFGWYRDAGRHRDVVSVALELAALQEARGHKKEAMVMLAYVGSAYLHLGQHSDAVDVLTRAHEMAPPAYLSIYGNGARDHVEVLTLLARAYRNLGDETAAVEWEQRAVESSVAPLVYLTESHDMVYEALSKALVLRADAMTFTARLAQLASAVSQGPIGQGFVGKAADIAALLTIARKLHQFSGSLVGEFSLLASAAGVSTREPETASFRDHDSMVLGMFIGLCRAVIEAAKDAVLNDMLYAMFCRTARVLHVLGGHDGFDQIRTRIDLAIPSRWGDGDEQRETQRRARALEELRTLYLVWGFTGGAWSVGTDVVRAYRRLGDDAALAHTLCEQGRIALRADRLDLAEDSLCEADKVLDRLDSPDPDITTTRAETLTLLGDLYERQGRSRKAANRRASARALREQLANTASPEGSPPPVRDPTTGG